ncbi:hypothetical protein MJN76_30610, partial [Salmonella enterica subsp. enterica serovar Anatum]|nr:hypothetical protein [Salmonella enterica subsp. enterica serovar Anatum]
PLHRAMPLFSGFRRSFPNLTRLFGAAVSKKEEKKIDTEGGMMAVQSRLAVVQFQADWSEHSRARARYVWGLTLLDLYLY